VRDGQTDWGFVSSNEGAPPGDEDGGKVEAKLFNLPAHLCSNPHLFSSRDRVRSSAIRRELCVEPLLLYIERSQLRWFRHLIRRRPTGRRQTQNSLEGLYVPSGLGTTAGSPRRSWSVSLGREMSEFLSWTCCLRNPTSDKGRRWMDGWIYFSQTHLYFSPTVFLKAS